MNRTFRSVLSVAIAGTALAAALQYFFPKQVPLRAPEARTVESFVSGARDALPAAVQTVRSAVGQIQAWAGFPPVPGFDQNIVLLKEPVVILNGSWADAQSLASGTHLGLVQQDGQYLQVQHGRRVITIPRSSAVSGAFHVR